MMNAYDEITERVSANRADSRNHYEDSDPRFQAAYNEIPICPVDYCQAAALRFNLPSCEVGGEGNEYLAFIIPRKTPNKKPPVTKPKEREQRPDEKIDDDRNRYYVPQHTPHIPECRWNTEYRRTIDDCARRVMSKPPRYEIGNSTQRNCCLKHIPENATPLCPNPQASKPIPLKNEHFSNRCSPRRMPNSSRSVSPRRPKVQREEICRKVVEPERPLLIKQAVKKPIAYNYEFFHEQSPTTTGNDSTKTKCTCEPSQDFSIENENSQKSTRRPMPRCHLEGCS